ncbi:putative SecC motif-containing protein [Roseibium sp. TrichSKD4]|uniref:hypothetical protein n=1 Tax=Roseibium sp. TrichSKD4 TaxID=744980 RepID=UPI0001E56337|nr:hypothetical protein [Roseibium sp. TrichSKD4]EFO33118.1 putative SecC motif-containing protein [Roseibium sp. TrichSKD4]
MDRTHIISELAGRNRLPWDALSACLDDPARTAAIFLPFLKRISSGSRLSEEEERALFYGLHVLAAQKAHASLPDLIHLLENHREEADRMMGDAAIGETLPRMLMALGANDPDVIWQFAASAPADWLIRDAFFKAWAYFVLNGTVPRSAAAKTLKALPDQMTTSPEDPVWISWLNIIADLGLTAVAPIVAEIIDQGRIERGPFALSEADYREFQKRLRDSTPSLRKSATWRRKTGYIPFGEPEQLKYDFYNAARLAPGTSETVSQTLLMKAAEDAAAAYTFGEAGNENAPLERSD